MHTITAVRVAVVDVPNELLSLDNMFTNVEVSPAKPVDIPGMKRLWCNQIYFPCLAWYHQMRHIPIAPTPTQPKATPSLLVEPHTLEQRGEGEESVSFSLFEGGVWEEEKDVQRGIPYFWEQSLDALEVAQAG